ncbi:MAG: Hint domain-containing protein [Chloroflexi bacterium]|nr:Hint domain-containing protein [Chloroflexota bacterium]
MTQQPKKLSRRDALKIIGAAAGATVLANLPSKWSKPELAAGVLPAHAQTSGPTLPTVVTSSIVGEFSCQASFTGDVTADGGSPVTDKGFVFSNTNSNPTLADSSISYGSGGLGSYSMNNVSMPYCGVTVYGRAYATSGVGTAYGAVLTFSPILCLVEGTLVAMADGTFKQIEDINYSDRLLVWNFDDGHFDAARPLWIKKAEVAYQYNLLEFSDGSTLKTINQHRIFNKELGMFTYPMTEDTPVGTTTFNVRGGEVRLASKRVVNERVNYYNVITRRHMNLFANGILTSCRYNNIYPIVDMKFVKDDRTLVPQEQYGVDDKYYEGLRLAEQTIPAADTIAYVNRLEALKADREGMIPADEDFFMRFGDFDPSQVEVELAAS